MASIRPIGRRLRECGAPDCWRAHRPSHSQSGTCPRRYGMHHAHAWLFVGLGDDANNDRKQYSNQNHSIDHKSTVKLLLFIFFSTYLSLRTDRLNSWLPLSISSRYLIGNCDNEWVLSLSLPSIAYSSLISGRGSRKYLVIGARTEAYWSVSVVQRTLQLLI